MAIDARMTARYGRRPQDLRRASTPLMAKELAMINDPYLTLEMHRVRVETLTKQARAGRLARALPRHAKAADSCARSTAAAEVKRSPAWLR